jgi:hypothetical protein
MELIGDEALLNGDAHKMSNLVDFQGDGYNKMIN